ncbi:MAG: DNA circularization N-terminal domain-containing protein, partial [Phenylobacterium sp.]|nr:DNA circularization N-terminal domain-containing protein [Phenylobacterium sp.]
MAWKDQLHRASWRGVAFAFEQGQARYGRRKVRHDYPGRDDIWMEDQGRLPREFRVQGFLVGHSRIYGGGDVLGQLQRMVAACEREGSGVLVHPTRGAISVELAAPLVVFERWDEGNYFELQFEFVQAGKRLFPSILGALSDLVGKAAGLADAAAAAAFVAKVAGPLRSGLDAVDGIARTAEEWIDKVTGLAGDATGLYGTLSQLGGEDFGRYFNGRNAGFLSGLSSPYAGAGSVAERIALGSAKRAAIAEAGEDLKATIGDLGVA